MHCSTYTSWKLLQTWPSAFSSTPTSSKQSLELQAHTRCLPGSPEPSLCTLSHSSRFPKHPTARVNSACLRGVILHLYSYYYSYYTDGELLKGTRGTPFCKVRCEHEVWHVESRHANFWTNRAATSVARLLRLLGRVPCNPNTHSARGWESLGRWASVPAAKCIPWTLGHQHSTNFKIWEEIK